MRMSKSTLRRSDEWPNRPASGESDGISPMGADQFAHRLEAVRAANWANPVRRENSPFDNRLDPTADAITEWDNWNDWNNWSDHA
jgi:hypothetical protein